MKSIKLSGVFLLIALTIQAQPPQAFKYQAVVRNNSGNLMQNQSVGVRISIHDITAIGTIIYQETFAETTNQFGLVNLVIGNGIPTIGIFSTIDWSTDSKFIETEIDPAGGTAYVSIGTSELLSVPYSIYSSHSADAVWNQSGNEIYYNNGNVGIGTSDPAGSLDVRGAGIDDGVVVNLGNSDLSHKLTLFGGREADPNPFLLWKEGDPFRLATDADGFSERMRITSEGRVGIGTHNPSAGLHVKGDGYPNSFMFLQSDTNADAGLRFYEGDTVKWHIFNRASADALYIYNANNTHTVFCADQSTGKVGIGTTNPSCKLEVNGKILIGNPSKGIMMYNNGEMVDIVSLGSGLALNYQTGENTVMNVISGNVGIGTSSPNAKLHVNEVIRVGEDPSYSTVYGELIHEGAGNGFKINAHAGGGSWADLHLQTNGTTKMFIESSGKVGIGTDNPIRKLQVHSSGSLDAIHGWSPDGTGVYAQSASSYGIFGQSTSGWAGYFSGPVHVTGSLSKGSGSFVIDHPLDPENKLLRHNFVESPENLLIYRGKAELNSHGEAIVAMPEYFKALTKEDDASIHITPVGRPFLTGAEWNADFSAITLYGESNRAVFWEVLADRDDPVIHELDRPVEEDKGGENSLCEQGKLLYPEAYGYPESMGRDYEAKK